MASHILVLHGPNLNLLGERPGDEPDVTLASVDRALTDSARRAGAEVRILQSNHEGALVDALQRERSWADAVLVDVGALAQSGHVLAETLAVLKVPFVEVAVSKRQSSVLGSKGRVVGRGLEVYLSALERLLEAPAASRPAGAKRTEPISRADSLNRERKTIGRGGATPAGDDRSAAKSADTQRMKSAVPLRTQPADARGAKTIGRGGRPPEAADAKTIGRSTQKRGAPDAGFLTCALVRQKIADRLRGTLTPAGLATWARQQYLDVERGAPAESGQRELLEDTLQRLTVSTQPGSRLSDEELVDLMAQLEG